jgi:hypothetical protein
MQIVENRTLSYYWANQADAGCEYYQQDVLNSLRPFGLEPSVKFPSHRQDVVLINGSHEFQQPVLDITSNKTGTGLAHLLCMRFTLTRLPASAALACMAKMAMLLVA